jgi:hypothetical protein
VASALPAHLRPQPHLQRRVRLRSCDASRVVDKFKAGINPQHVVPSWDLKTLWVTNNAEGRTDGSLTPIDPRPASPARRSRWTIPTTCTSPPTASPPSWWRRRSSASTSAIPTRWRCSGRLPRRTCAGINHADFAIDGKS